MMQPLKLNEIASLTDQQKKELKSRLEQAKHMQAGIKALEAAGVSFGDLTAKLDWSTQVAEGLLTKFG